MSTAKLCLVLNDYQRLIESLFSFVTGLNLNPNGSKIMTHKSKTKRQFSKFSQRDAFKLLGITRLQPWDFTPMSVVTTDFFQERLVIQNEN